jgi:Clp amino terminal domain, pathogenicity island component
LLDGFALRLTDGYAAAAPTLTRALELVLALDVADDEVGRWLWLAGGRATSMVALELWDDESWHALVAVQAQSARDTGAPVHLQLASEQARTLGHGAVTPQHLLAGVVEDAREPAGRVRMPRRHRRIVAHVGLPAGYQGAAGPLLAALGVDRDELTDAVAGELRGSRS